MNAGTRLLKPSVVWFTHHFTARAAFVWELIFCGQKSGWPSLRNFIVKVGVLDASSQRATLWRLKLPNRAYSNPLWVSCVSSIYFVALLGATTAAAPAATAPIRIGIILPLTGPSSDVGGSALIGANVAVQEINAVGGYMGRPIELVVHDDTANPEEAHKAADKMASDPTVVGLVGVCNTAVAIKVAEVAQAKQLPLIVSCATGSTITSRYPAAQSYIFRTSASSQIQAQFIVNDILKAKLHKVALLLDNSPYGDAGLTDLQAAFAKVGMRPKVVMRFELGTKSLEREIKELKASGADALIGWTVGPDQGVIAASRAAAGWQVPLYGAWDASNASAFNGSNGRLEGNMMVQTVLPNRHLERNSAFLTAYSKHSRERPMGSMIAAAQTYDAVQLLVRAIYVAKGDLQGHAIKVGLENLQSVYRGVVTSYHMPFSNHDHDAISINMLWMGSWRGGERVYAYDEDERRAAVIRTKQ